MKQTTPTKAQIKKYIEMRNAAEAETDAEKRKVMWAKAWAYEHKVLVPRMK